MAKILHVQLAHSRSIRAGLLSNAFSLALRGATATALNLALSGCEYAGLLRPSVLSQLNPPVARLVNELPELDSSNEAIVAELYATGGAARATEGPDGIMRADITVPMHHMLWTPAVIVMPRGGPLELRFSNYDHALHMAYLPSNGGRQLLHLPAGKGGRAA